MQLWLKFPAAADRAQAGKRSFDCGFALLSQSKFLAQDDSVI
jgi:hypothetical protein